MNARATENRTRSKQAFARAEKVLVGGVNSPVRAFGSVGGTPVFVEKADGAIIHDIDGNEYIDLVGSWGPAIVGHAHPAVVEAVTQAASRGLSFGASCEAESELAELILSALPHADLIRFVNSGTEAVMSAIRLARAATDRPGIVKFVGCYHGHSDALLVAAGSGASTFGTPDSAGVTAEATRNTLLTPYNDLDAVEALLAQHGETVAAILVEPLAGNMGYVEPEPGFLEGLRHLCDKHGCLLVFDEVMSGFRVAWGSMQSIVGVAPDITCLGKVIGGGMPVAAYAARESLMKLVSPLGPMYQAGTLSGNPIGMAAGLATLRLCNEAGFYESLERKSTALVRGVADAAQRTGVSVHTGATGGMFGITFSPNPVRNFDDAKSANHSVYSRFFHAMLDRGVWLPPSGYEAMFMSAAHTNEHITSVVTAASDAFKEIMEIAQ